MEEPMRNKHPMQPHTHTHTHKCLKGLHHTQSSVHEKEIARCYLIHVDEVKTDLKYTGLIFRALIKLLNTILKGYLVIVTVNLLKEKQCINFLMVSIVSVCSQSLPWVTSSGVARISVMVGHITKISWGGGGGWGATPQKIF